MRHVFLLDSKVRFTNERLSILTPRDRQRLAGRIGVVQTDGSRVEKPTVYFPADGTRMDLRLFRVDPRQIELVESQPDTPNEPLLGVDVNQDGLANHAADAETAAIDKGDRLSQSDMDKLFD